MKNLKYGLVVSDFDGTLVQNDHEVGQESKKQIEEYLKNGGIFVISTGRLPVGIMPRIKELGLKGVVSCCQGSVIMEIESEKRILDDKLSYETTLAIVKKMEQMGLHIHIYGEWDYYCNMDDEALKKYEDAVRIKAKLVTDRPLSQFVEENKYQAYKVMAMVRYEDNEKTIRELSACNFEGCEVIKSARSLVEVINAKNSKGTAVEFLANHYNVPIERVIAIGDQCNDISMIERAGLGIAVKNADNALKEVASVVFDYTNDENAVGKIIEKFAYEEKI